MLGYINRLFGWGHQPKKKAEEMKKRPGMIIESGTVEIADELTRQFGPPSQFDVSLYNKRLELLKYLVENNQEDAVGQEINALLTALMEQLQVKVYEPPDEFEYEVVGPHEKDGE
ncbi:hypothetical protein KQ941_02805 [Paenibacillus xylanexedens]|uniref:hypothetical protein n=1 Tax=Paenibacillus xylanexedens TaxID=528191 RepID=UPI001F42EF98|nr:hypothetical protein [Paenibacillus xylanexedens]MCF7753358.1 hypothetical protein [Paenibacillus xylanexedens]